MNRPAIAFTAPYRVYLPDEFFDVLTSAGVARVKALPLPPISTSSTSQVKGSNVEIEHDIFGFAGRTRFCVVLSKAIDTSQPEWKQAVCAEDHAFVTASLDAVNRLLAVYRDHDINGVGRQSFHIIELIREDLSDIQLVVVDEDLHQVSDLTITWPGFRSMGFGSSVNRSSDVIAAIRADLASNTPIPIERELLTSAQNHLWRRQLRLVPIEANTAFESFSLEILKQIDPSTTLPDTSDIYTKLVAIEKAVRLTSAAKSQAVNWFDTTTPGWKGLLNKELLDWHSNCYDLRNRVIHRGYNAVQTLEAKIALDSTVTAMEFLKSNT